LNIAPEVIVTQEEMEDLVQGLDWLYDSGNQVAIDLILATLRLKKYVYNEEDYVLYRNRYKKLTFDKMLKERDMNLPRNPYSDQYIPSWLSDGVYDISEFA
jgi:hypothetical protein